MHTKTLFLREEPVKYGKQFKKHFCTSQLPICYNHSVTGLLDLVRTDSKTFTD